MKLTTLLPVAIAGAMVVGSTACKKETKILTVVDTDTVTVIVNDTTAPSGPSDSVLSGTVNANRTLAGGKWTLKGYVYVTNGATLTIPAGTIIKSDITDKGALIIESGAKIDAQGTASSPIVFTSGLPRGQRRPGDWGGIIILGRATTNRGTGTLPTIEGGVGRTYGGTDDADNSGTMRYVRIEFAGIAAAPGSEINGLTLGGVGSGTTIENIMVSYANDDAFEFFGGTVNARNLIAWGCSDDDYDFDFGYRGQLQYGISARIPAIADVGDASNGIECDNDGTGSTATPTTRPVMSNFTFVGPGARANTAANHNYGLRFRRGAQFVLRNSVIVGHQRGGLALESAATADAFNNGLSEFKNNLIGSQTTSQTFISGSGSTLTAAQIETKALAEGNLKADSVGTAGFTNWTSLTAPNFTPTGSSPLLSGAAFAGLAAYFQVVNFRGAIGATDWTAGWANWNPNDATY